jgi:hypothetical protein
MNRFLRFLPSLAMAVFISSSKAAQVTGSALFVFLLIGVVWVPRMSAQATLGTPSNVVSMNVVTAPDDHNTHSYKIASLPASTDGTFDHLHLAVGLNFGWGATQNTYFDATFANRGGFSYQYTQRGATAVSQARLVAYQASPGATVDLYLVFAPQYNTASWTVLDNLQETIYSNPIDTLGTLPSDATIVFDTGNPSLYPPAIYASLAGAVGIGTSSPGAKLDVQGGTISVGGLPPLSTGGVLSGTSTDNHWVKLYSSLAVGAWNPIVQPGDQALIYSGAGMGTGGFVLAPWAGYSGLRMDNAGNVGLGAASPSEKLEVNGNVKLTANSGAHVIFPDGSQQSVAWTGVLSGGDYAESVDVTGDRSGFEPGDVLVINPKAHGQFKKASTPYSALIGGVYATKPGVTGRRQPRSKPSNEEVPMAMVGIVPTKVSTENGPIHDGDLLVSSSTPGYAMKGTDRDRMMGAVIGKALAPLEAGSGVIEVLISLQ